ncbi:MAG: cupin domain-containing protein, partial [Chloroflexota bacterium]|nr:cupin domain-containing protein [Chloroflexota bacterium]
MSFRRPLRVLFAFLFVLSIVPAVLMPAQAQDEEEIDTDALFGIDLEAGALPPVPAFIRLVRITLEPGAVSPEHTHPGPEFGRIESGVVTVQVTGPAKIKQRSAEPDDPFEDASQGSAIQLDRGDQIYYPAGTPLTFRNDGEEQARILALVILPAAPEGQEGPPLIDYTGNEPGEAAFEGLSSKILGDGIATTLPTGTSRVTIQRVKLNEGQSLPGSRNPVLYSVTSGDCEFTITGGSVQISRTREPGPQNDSPVDTEVELRPGDAMFLPQGVRTTSRGENSDDLDLIQVIVAPTGSGERLSEESRGSIRFVQPNTPPELDDED